MKYYKVTYDNGYKEVVMLVKAKNMSQVEAHIKNYSSYFEVTNIELLSNNLEDGTV